jgi:hypothetical protein
LDDNYQTYINKVAPTILPKSHQQQLENICKSAKFDGQNPVPFPGYTVMTPPWQDDQENYSFYHQLQLLQQRLLENLPPSLLIPLPPPTFHLTIADLIWDHGYREALKKNSEFPNQLRENIAHSFEEYTSSFSTASPLKFQLLGLTVFPRAIVVSLVPNNEFNYNQIISLRRCIYQNHSLIALGIEQQYDFTAHISLGYFGEIPDNLDRDSVVHILDNLNQQWIEKESPTITIHQVELRQFDDMITYNWHENYPTIRWGIK